MVAARGVRSLPPGFADMVTGIRRGAAAGLLAALLLGCGSRPGSPDGTVVIAAVREPAAVFPPLVRESVGRDIGDLIYERLADLVPGGAPADPLAYRPRLAARWERLDSITWRFHLRPGARWQDGAPVTAEDVRFSFAAFSDSTLNSPARGYLADQVRVEVESPSTFLVRFVRPSPEQLYDATYHVRILPRHLWASRPSATWAAADPGLLIGSGSYRLVRWKRGEFAVLEADSSAWRRARIGRLIWRFTADPDAALNLALSGAADLLEQVGPPNQQVRFEGDPAFMLRSYPSALYGFLAFGLVDSAGHPHRIFGHREIRRALALAVDRPRVAQALLGPATQAPPGPMSQVLWIGDAGITVLPFAPEAARSTLDVLGWRTGKDGVRERTGHALSFDILVPSTSLVRKQAALILQETWRRLGAQVTVTAVDFPVFQERIQKGAFDTYIGAYLDEPSPRGIADQFSRRGWDALNFGKYANPRFDSLLARAAAEPEVGTARRLYREALDTLNADVPAIFLYAPTNVAAIRRTLTGVTLDPYSWLANLPEWRISPGEAQRLVVR